MADHDRDPFASIIDNVLYSSSQEELLSHAKFAREDESFPDDENSPPVDNSVASREKLDGGNESGAKYRGKSVVVDADSVREENLGFRGSKEGETSGTKSEGFFEGGTEIEPKLKKFKVSPLVHCSGKLMIEGEEVVMVEGDLKVEKVSPLNFFVPESVELTEKLGVGSGGDDGCSEGEGKTGSGGAKRKLDFSLETEVINMEEEEEIRERDKEGECHGERGGEVGDDEKHGGDVNTGEEKEEEIVKRGKRELPRSMFGLVWSEGSECEIGDRVVGNRHVEGLLKEAIIEGNSNVEGRLKEANVEGNSNLEGGLKEAIVEGNSNVEGSLKEANVEGNSNAEGGLKEGNSNAEGGLKEANVEGNSNLEGGLKEANAKGNNVEDSLKEANAKRNNVEDGLKDTNVEGNSNLEGGLQEGNVEENSNVEGGLKEANVEGNSNFEGGLQEGNVEENSNVEGGLKEANVEGNSSVEGGLKQAIVAGNSNVEAALKPASVGGSKEGKSERIEEKAIRCILDVLRVLANEKRSNDNEEIDIVETAKRHGMTFPQSRFLRRVEKDA